MEEQKTFTKVTRLKISVPVFPTTSWKVFNAIMKTLHEEVRLASNQCTQLCNIEYAMNPDSTDSAMKRGNLSHEMYSAARAYAPYLGAYNSASISKTIGDLYFGKTKGSYVNKMRRGDGNPPMSYGKEPPIPIYDKKSFKFTQLKNGRYNFSFSLVSTQFKNDWNQTIAEKEIEKCAEMKNGVFTVGIDTTNGDVKSTVRKIINGEYIMCGSNIVKYKGHYYIHLVCKIPVHTKGINLDDKRILGVDLGVNNPAFVAVNFDDKIGCSFGGTYIIRQKMKYERMLKQTQKQATIENKGGHGRKPFVEITDNIRHKRSNYTINCNRNIANQIVQFAIKNECATIQMEDLSGFSSKLQSDKFLGKWTYYQLRTFVEQKANQYGIIVQLVDPKNTSITCSQCGHVATENRPKGDKGAEYFKCVKCGYGANADFNAAKNIARSLPKSVTDKEKKKSKKTKCDKKVE